MQYYELVILYVMFILKYILYPYIKNWVNMYIIVLWKDKNFTFSPKLQRALSSIAIPCYYISAFA